MSSSAKCEICGKVFSSSGYKNEHVDSVHRGIRHECPHCEKTFSNRGNLNTHLKIHQSSKHPYQCDICGKGFSTMSVVAKHTDSVHRWIKHECPHCEKTFSYRDNLNTHLKLHRSSKHPYQCDICGNGFATMKVVAEHTDSVHRGIKHECPHCEKTFSKRGNLQRHLKKAFFDSPLKYEEIWREYNKNDTNSKKLEGTKTSCNKAEIYPSDKSLRKVENTCTEPDLNLAGSSLGKNSTAQLEDDECFSENEESIDYPEGDQVDVQRHVVAPIPNVYEAREEDDEEIWVTWDVYKKAQEDYTKALEERRMLEAKDRWLDECIAAAAGHMNEPNVDEMAGELEEMMREVKENDTPEAYAEADAYVNSMREDMDAAFLSDYYGRPNLRDLSNAVPKKEVAARIGGESEPNEKRPKLD